MKKNKIIEIIQLCLAIDVKASELYSRFASLSHGKLKIFWQKMANEEGQHVEFWKELVLLGDQGMVPQIFEDFKKVKSELDSINRKVNALTEEDNINTARDLSKMFLIAYRMEYFLLHPAFERLFHFASFTDLNKPNPEEAYEDHMKEFITALSTYGNMSPEMELLGETLQRLWWENRNLVRQSVLDNLTGVLNRRGFFEHIKPLCYLAQRNNLTVGLLMIDIDDFKRINDTHGHQKGDMILRHTASVLSHVKRASDMVGRYGGEEFIIYLSAVEPEALFEIAERFRKEVTKRNNKYGVPVTISIGAALGVFKENVDKELFDFINVADKCLYSAKKRGKNKVVIRHDLLP